jgi:hypothetical protein
MQRAHTCYSWDSVTEAYEQLFKQVIEETGSTGSFS